ncbi:ABC transporter permease [Danxiaibacter flavus]|uniref:ABC transporter permease n=1 Tax=Danxiaibacter flavus TaxID=3049108 RepID=A0ABV3ZEN1_9BACT|nr:ABC transporter permease [Chitinophagaceae bacterium DXS]
MFRYYLKTAIRNLTRNKIYTIINISGLSIGLACAMLIILYVKDEVSYDRFHKNVGNIYRIVNRNVEADGKESGKSGYTGYLQGPRFKSAVPEIVSFVRFRSGQMDMKTGDEIKPQDLRYADSNFFSVFTFPLLKGNPKTALLQPNSVVISDEVAKKQFGTTDALGKTIMLKGDDKFEPYIVTGVAKKAPQNSSIKFDLLLPMVVSKEDAQNNQNWFSFFMNTFVVINPNADTKVAGQKMTRFFEKDAADVIRMIAEKFDFHGRTEYSLQPFLDMHLSKDLPADNGLSDSSNPMFSYILGGIAIFVLLIACINFVNLTVARSLKRAKEIGIRKVVGGERKQLIFQFLGESFALCFLAFLLAIILVQVILPVFNDLSNKALSISYLFDLKLIAGYIGLFLLTGLLAGFYPALVLSNYNPVNTLYSRFNLGGKNYLQKSLVVLQFTLASFLITATLIIYSQFNYLTTTKLGYDDTNLIIVGKGNLNRNEAALFRNELMKSSGVVDVALKNGGFWGSGAKINGEEKISFAYETVSVPYIPMLKVPILQGRNFSLDLPSDSTQSVIVNEEFVKKAGWKQPLGQQVRFVNMDNTDETYTVIGVVKNYHFESLNQKIKEQLFTMKPKNPYGDFYIKIRPGTSTAALKDIEKTYKKLFPINPYSYDFKDQQNRNSYQSEAKWKQIMLFGAILTIFISSIGLFGLSVLSAEKRTKEIGIRKVLGASVSSVVRILSRDFLSLVAIALLAAIPMAWIAANRWLENYPYRVNLSWWMFASAGIFVLLIALFTVSFQAIRAATANPVKSLRTE